VSVVFFFIRFNPNIYYRRNLAVDARIIGEAKATDQQMTQLLTKRNVLRHRIDKWRGIQDIYMPSITKYRAESISPDGASEAFTYPETIPLHLPSALSTDIISTVPSNVIDIETRLRISQADDSLNDLKRFLRVTMGLWDFKRANIGPSQRSSTRMYATISAFREKVNRCANRYRAARRALSVLDPGGTWVIRLQKLKPTDVRPPIRDMDKLPKRKSAHDASNTTRTDREANEGRRTLSWIWLAARPTGTEVRGENVEVTQAEINESKSQICSALKCIT
jgi:hypothetical protein